MSATSWMLDVCFSKLCRVYWFQLAFQCLKIQYVSLTFEDVNTLFGMFIFLYVSMKSLQFNKSELSCCCKYLFYMKNNFIPNGLVARFCSWHRPRFSCGPEAPSQTGCSWHQLFFLKSSISRIHLEISSERFLKNWGKESQRQSICFLMIKNLNSESKTGKNSLAFINSEALQTSGVYIENSPGKMSYKMDTCRGE